MTTIVVMFKNGERRFFPKVERTAMDTNSNEFVIISNEPGFSATIPRENIQYYYAEDPQAPKPTRRRTRRRPFDPDMALAAENYGDPDDVEREF